MLTLPPGVRVFLATERVDGRKGIDGLAALVRSRLAEDPLTGSMYVFFTRRADRVRDFGAAAREPGARRAASAQP